MRYTVTSPLEVNDELALIWIHATDKSAVSRAANEIDAILRSWPLDYGIEQGEQRVLTIDPLSVVYSVSQADCQVSIHQFVYHG